MQQAVATNTSVVVDSLTTPTELVTAHPEGYFTSEMSSDIERLKAPGGEWRDVDLALLRRSDGTIGPAVSDGSVAFSNGGPAGSLLASYGSAGFSYEILAPFAVPAPTLATDTATYPDVIPGVDLVLQATTAGFSHSWVVKTRVAGSDPRIRSLTLQVRSSGLRPLASSGGTAYVDAGGVKRLWTPTPTMWDSSGASSTSSTADLATDGPIGHDAVATVATTTTTDSLTLRPNLAMLDDPNAVFPIVIDPAVTFEKNRNGWTAVWDNFPSKSFWQTPHSLGAGYEGFEQFKVVRSYFRFNTEALAGKHIISATANVLQVHAASCSARPTQIFRTGTIGDNTTWNNQPKRFGLQDSNNSTVGCGAGQDYVGWDVTPGITTAADSGLAQTTFMLKAQDETDQIAWKQFEDDGASVVVKYVSVPAKPKSVAVKVANNSYGCATSAAEAPFVNASSQTLNLKATAVSADGTTADMKLFFERVNVTTGGTPADLVTSNYLPSGGSGEVSWGSLVNGTTYKFRVYSRVYWNSGANSLRSTDSTSWCFFKFDNTKPQPPALSSTAFIECLSPDLPDPSTCPATGTAHVAGPVVVDDVSTANNATAYKWSLNGSTPISVTTSGGAARTINLMPDRIMNVFKVWSVSASGVEGATKEFWFKVNPLRPTAAWSFDSTSVTLNEGSGTTEGALTLNSGVVDSRGRVAKSLRFSGGTPATATPSTVSTTTDFSVSAWVRAEGSANATLLSAPGSSSNAFQLTFTPSTNTWAVGRTVSNGSSTVQQTTSATGVRGVWTHVAAVYQSSTKKLALYVDGSLQGSVVYSTAGWSNTAGWHIGCGRTAGVPSGCSTSAIDQVELFKAALSGVEVAALANPMGADEHPVMANGAVWEMEDAAISTTALESSYGAGLAVSGVTNPFGLSADGVTTGVLRLPGSATQAVSRTGPVVDARTSFTVSAKVVLTNEDLSGVVLQQRGISGPTWSLLYRASAAGGGQWVFNRSGVDATNAATTEVRSAVSTGATGVATFVSGVYDSGSGELRLYVNGRTFEPSTGTIPAESAAPVAAFAAPWQARGNLQLGYGTDAGVSRPFAGEVHTAIVQIGALDDYGAPLLRDRCDDGVCGLE